MGPSHPQRGSLTCKRVPSIRSPSRQRLFSRGKYDFCSRWDIFLFAQSQQVFGSSYCAISCPINIRNKVKIRERTSCGVKNVSIHSQLKIVNLYVTTNWTPIYNWNKCGIERCVSAVCGRNIARSWGTNVCISIGLSNRISERERERENSLSVRRGWRWIREVVSVVVSCGLREPACGSVQDANLHSLTSTTI